MSSEEEKNKALARRFVGAFASGDMDTPEELMAPSGEIGTYSSIRIHRKVGGKITDEWSEGSLLEMLLPAIEREIR